jgi:hypothetical protein
VTFEEPIGEHSLEAVSRALAEMARDGVVVLAPGSGSAATLPR